MVSYMALKQFTSGNFYDVKGISTGENDMVNGVSVKAHVKALPQTN